MHVGRSTDRKHTLCFSLMSLLSLHIQHNWMTSICHGHSLKSLEEAICSPPEQFAGSEQLHDI